MAGCYPPGVTGSENHFNPPDRTVLVCEQCEQIAGLRHFDPSEYVAHPTPNHDARGHCEYHGHHDEFRTMVV